VPDQPDALLQRVAFECFLCGTPLNRIHDHAQQDTNEDVYPRWLQRRYDLADLTVSFGGGQRRKKYSEILVPACRQCNNIYLSSVEDRISRAVVSGFQSFNSLPKYILFLWCAKIYYGLMHHEVQPRDGTTKLPEVPTLPPHFLKDCAWLLQLLQGFRKRVLVSGHPKLPFSIIRVPLQIGKDESFYFQSRQMMEMPGVALQLGRVGVISVLDDFGHLEDVYAHAFAKTLDGHALHPVQFWELAARLLYVASLYSFHTRLIKVEGDLDMWIEYEPVDEPHRAHNLKEEASLAHGFALPWARIVANDANGLPFWKPATGATLTYLMSGDKSFQEMPIGDNMP
jgi:hypothetical protein